MHDLFYSKIYESDNDDFLWLVYSRMSVVCFKRGQFVTESPAFAVTASSSIDMWTLVGDRGDKHWHFLLIKELFSAIIKGDVLIAIRTITQVNATKLLSGGTPGICGTQAGYPASEMQVTMHVLTSGSCRR